MSTSFPFARALVVILEFRVENTRKNTKKHQKTKGKTKENPSLRKQTVVLVQYVSPMCMSKIKKMIPTHGKPCVHDFFLITARFFGKR